MDPKGNLSESDLSNSGLAQQEIWRKRLAAAELAYHQASRDLQNVPQEAGRSPDEARERKTEARLEYLRVLRIFTHLVLRGKLPAGSKPNRATDNLLE
jgi:hypothetical protein